MTAMYVSIYNVCFYWKGCTFGCNGITEWKFKLNKYFRYCFGFQGLFFRIEGSAKCGSESLLFSFSIKFSILNKYLKAAC